MGLWSCRLVEGSYFALEREMNPELGNLAAAVVVDQQRAQQREAQDVGVD